MVAVAHVEVQQNQKIKFALLQDVQSNNRVWWTWRWLKHSMLFLPQPFINVWKKFWLRITFLIYVTDKVLYSRKSTFLSTMRTSCLSQICRTQRLLYTFSWFFFCFVDHESKRSMKTEQRNEVRLEDLQNFLNKISKVFFCPIQLENISAVDNVEKTCDPAGISWRRNVPSLSMGMVSFRFGVPSVHGQAGNIKRPQSEGTSYSKRHIIRRCLRESDAVQSPHAIRYGNGNHKGL